MSKKFAIVNSFKYFHDGGPYHIETSPLIYKANQWTGFYIIGTSVMKELNSNHLYVVSNTLSTDKRYWQNQAIENLDNF